MTYPCPSGITEAVPEDLKRGIDGNASALSQKELLHRSRRVPYVWERSGEGFRQIAVHCLSC